MLLCVRSGDTLDVFNTRVVFRSQPDRPGEGNVEKAVVGEAEVIIRVELHEPDLEHSTDNYDSLGSDDDLCSSCRTSVTSIDKTADVLRLHY